MIKKVGQNLKLYPANGKQGPAALTNYKQDNVDQIKADNIIKPSGVPINRKKN
jgi:hypothetical protein